MQCIQVGALCNGNLKREKLGRRPNPKATKETLGLHHQLEENPGPPSSIGRNHGPPSSTRRNHGPPSSIGRNPGPPSTIRYPRPPTAMEENPGASPSKERRIWASTIDRKETLGLHHRKKTLCIHK
jgi:hypothetical protein